MRETNVWRLTMHFFRRFFENDLVPGGEDVLTTVIRALAIVTAPGLMFAFWLQNQYPQRTPWGRLEDEYFFVMFSFVTMAGVAVFEWEMLFPDRLDFLVLTPLSLRKWEMPTAKATALAMFFGLFLASTNVFGILMLPGITGPHFWRQVGAQAAATLSAGMFGALLITLLGGALLCVVPSRMFRTVSLVFRMLAVTVLCLVVIHYGRFGDLMPQLLADGGRRMRSVPTFWFLGLYQELQHGGAAPAFAFWMMRRAASMLTLVVVGVALVYPLAWIRMQRMAIEEEGRRAAKPSRWMSDAVHCVVRSPEERAVFHFVGQTITRNSRYQVYMAIYFGVGLALAISSAIDVQVRNGAATPAVSSFGLHAVMPLLVFWSIAGVKMACAFPLQLHAKWVFRTTGAALAKCVTAARKWALGCGLTVVFAVTGMLVCVGWNPRKLIVQAVCGVCLCALLVDGFFFAQTTVPFSQPRRPGKTNLPMILTLYIGVLAPFIFGMIFLELRIERNLLLLIAPVALVPTVHWFSIHLRERSVLIEEEREGNDGEFQLLGLAGELSS